MKSTIGSNSKKIMRLEDSRASTGEFSQGDLSSERAVHEAQVKHWDTRKALALSSLGRVQTPISYIRSLLQRGNLTQARASIQQIHSLETELSPESLSQLLFEETRLAFFEGQWSEVLLASDRALLNGPGPTTVLALFQLKASAYFEMGLFAEAANAIEEAENLGRLFPYAISHFYGRIMKVRIVARSADVKQAEILLDRIFIETLKLGRLDLDVVLTYLRAIIDLNRLARRPIANESLACFHIADAIGDKLYCALAEFDFQSSFAIDAMELARRVSTVSKQFTRVESLMNAVLGEEPGSVTASTIRDSLLISPASSQSLKVQSANCRDYSVPFQEGYFRSVCLLVRRHDLLIELDGPVFHRIKSDTQNARGLLAVATGNAEKSEFFKAIWGNQAYSPRLHDPLINSLVHRIRKEYGIEIQVHDGRIETGKSVVVL